MRRREHTGRLIPRVPLINIKKFRKQCREPNVRVPVHRPPHAVEHLACPDHHRLSRCRTKRDRPILRSRTPRGHPLAIDPGVHPHRVPGLGPPRRLRNRSERRFLRSRHRERCNRPARIDHSRPSSHGMRVNHHDQKNRYPVFRVETPPTAVRETQLNPRKRYPIRFPPKLAPRSRLDRRAPPRPVGRMKRFHRLWQTVDPTPMTPVRL